MILNTLMPFFIKVHTSFSSFRLSSSIDLPRQIFVSLIYLHSLISSDYFCSHFSFFFHSFVSSFHPPFYHLPPTPLRSHIRSLPFSRCPPLSFCFSFSLSLTSQSTRQATSMSATARFQAVEGNWLYPAVQRRAFTHTPFGDNPGRAARNTPMVQLKRREKTRGTIKRT